MSLNLGGAAPVVPAGLGRVREVAIDAGGTVSVAGLAARAGVPEAEAGGWLDDWRDF
jgi:hypothetical protein